MKRHPRSPLLTRDDLPDVPPRLIDATSVFNPGAVRHDERYLLLLRVQARSRETFWMVAESADGVAFEVRPHLAEVEGLSGCGVTIHHAYDPRITVLDGRYHVTFAADTDDGCRIGIARTDDFERFELVSFGGPGEDTRNGVLFPEKIGGCYARLERPNRIALSDGPTSGDEIVLSESTDLVTWRAAGSVMRGRPRLWDERIGSGPPPVKTREGWLHLYHGIATHFGSTSIYQAGVVLLDLEDPSRVLARSHHNVLEPREPWEVTGQVPNVVFPSGMIVEDIDEDGFALPDSRVLVYYGAADTCVGLAVTTVQALLGACD